MKAGKSEKKYDFYFHKFKLWCLDYVLNYLPASITTIALYLTFLIQSNVSTSVLNASFYSLKWEHELNLFVNIFNDNFLKFVLEGGIRTLAKPVNKKCPITPEILRNMENLTMLKIYVYVV